MAVFYDITEYAASREGTAVALGFFDGVHLGHRAVLAGCAGEQGGLRSVALTFRESPAAALGRGRPPMLTDNERKASLISALGVEDVIFADFGAVKDLSAEAFVKEILRDKLNARAVYCGFNYRFGKNGGGDTAALRELARACGMTVKISEPVYLDGEQVSSTRIREYIADGEIGRANAMLGYPYGIAGKIADGNHIGTTMGFPTVNIPIGAGTAAPRRGVYASRITIDGQRYRGATNIGVHPTVGESESPLCETFILDYHGGSLYGKDVVCELMRFIRPERRFDSIGALTEQVKADCERIKHMGVL